MKTTASLPPGRLRVFMEERIKHNGEFMPRFLALQMQAEERVWSGLSHVVATPAQPIENDLAGDTQDKDDQDELAPIASLRAALAAEQRAANRVKNGWL